MFAFFLSIGFIGACGYFFRERPLALLIAWISLITILIGFIYFPIMIWYVLLTILAIALMTLLIIALPYLLAMVFGVMLFYFGFISFVTFIESIAG
jgi:hypothetical protein